MMASALSVNRATWEASRAHLALVALAMPDSPIPGLMGGQLAFQAGDYTAAVASLNAALVRAPTNPLIHRVRAECAYRQGDFTGAVEHLLTAVRLEPETAPTTWYLLAVVYARLERYDAALGRIERAQQAVPPGVTALTESFSRFEAAVRVVMAARDTPEYDTLRADLIAGLTLLQNEPA